MLVSPISMVDERMVASSRPSFNTRAGVVDSFGSAAQVEWILVRDVLLSWPGDCALMCCVTVFTTALGVRVEPVTSYETGIHGTIVPRRITAIDRC